MRKRMALILTATFVIALLSGCSKGELPTEVQGVGEPIIKEQDVLPSANEIPDSLNIFGRPNGEIDLTKTDGGQITVDKAKEWIAECVNGDYTKAEDGDIVVEVAPMKDGGVAALTTYCGFYYSTEFRYAQDSDDILENAEKNVSAYIGRDLTDMEKEELSSAAANVVDGVDSAFVQSLRDTAKVYVFIENEKIVFQCF